MKREIKSKRCALDQDKVVITNLVSLLEDEKEEFDNKGKVIGMMFYKSENKEKIKDF